MISRRATAYGAVCGLAGALLALGAVGAARVLDDGDGGSAADSCHGADVRVSLSTAPGRGSTLVTGQVEIWDEDGARDWQVRWPGSGTETGTVPATDLPRLLQSYRLLGDTDDGLRRSVWLRPAGE